eukprot:c28733_g1_i1 orf=610-810(-)
MHCSNCSNHNCYQKLPSLEEPLNFYYQLMILGSTPVNLQPCHAVTVPCKFAATCLFLDPCWMVCQA